MSTHLNSTNKFILVLTLCLVSTLNWAVAQNYTVTTDNWFNGTVNCVEVANDDKTYLAGYFTNGRASGSSSILLNTTSSAEIPSANIEGSIICSAKIPASLGGGMYLGGTINRIEDKECYGLIRIDSLGNFDPTFLPTINYVVRAICLDDDGNIIVGGNMTVVNGKIVTYLFKLDANGLLDDLFTPKLNNPVLSVQWLTNNSILAAGQFTQVSNTNRPYMAKVSSITGALDTLFQPATTGYVSKAIQVEQNKIYTKSHISTSAGTMSTLEKYDDSGDVDTNFLGNFSKPILDFTTDPSNNIYVTGHYDSINNYPISYVSKFNSSGALDTNFNTNMPNLVNRIISLNNSELVVSTKTNLDPNDLEYTVLKIDSTGMLVPGFTKNLIGGATTFSLDKDSNLFLGGYLESTIFSHLGHIARLDANDILDTTYNPAVNTPVSTMAVDSNGNLYVGGYFTEANGLPRNKIAKFDSLGQLDLDFDPEIVGYIYDLTIDPNNNIVICGNLDSLNGSACIGIINLDSNGDLIPSFPVVSLFTPWSTVSRAKYDANGNLYMIGVFQSVNGVGSYRLAKVRPNGTVDTNFAKSIAPGLSSSPGLYDLNISQSCDVIISGDFLGIDGHYINRIAKFDTIGTLDTNFHLSQNLPDKNKGIYTIEADTSGGTFIGGNFTWISDTWQNNQLHRFLAHLGDSGAINLNFQSDKSFENVNTTSIIFRDLCFSSGKLYAAGGSGPRFRIYKPCINSPTFSTHPVSQSICSGKNIAFNSCAENGRDLRFIWLKNGIPMTNEKNSALYLHDCQEIDSGAYQIVAYNQCGSDTSNVAYLNVQNTYGDSIISNCFTYTSPFGTIYTNAGAYYDTLQTDGGCDSIIPILLERPEILTVNISGQPLTLTTNFPNASHVWLNCNNNYAVVFNALGPTFTPPFNGSWAAKVTLNGCVDTTDCFVVNDLSINELNNISTTIVPNPANNWFSVEFNSTDQIDLLVVDMQGKTILEKQILSGEKCGVVDFAKGIYIVKLIYNDQYYLHKLVVE